MIKKLIAKKLKTMTKKEDPQDVGLDIFLDECHHGYYQEELPDCGLEHPKLAGGHSQGINGEKLCYPNAANRPDCYQLVTVYKHEIPCLSTVCYEDHEDFLVYVDSHDNNSTKVSL